MCTWLPSGCAIDTKVVDDVEIVAMVDVSSFVSLPVLRREEDTSRAVVDIPSYLLLCFIGFVIFYLL